MDRRIVGICGLLLCGVSFYATQSLTRATSLSISEPSTQNEVVIDGGQSGDVSQKQFLGPKTEECPINGEKLTKEERSIWEKRGPLVVMIENHTDARPQSGLSQADVVYEAVAEGGITRFATVFYCKDAPYVGPVRSARMYFIDFASEYGQFPLYAHVGGANTPGPADALGKIRKINWAGNNDLNQFSIPFPYFFRDYERLSNRATEHTMYSSTTKLWEFAKEKRGLSNVDKKGNRWDKDFVSWKFKNDSPSKSALATKIEVPFWQGKSSYVVSWNYQSKNNTYARSHGGVPHLDKNTNKQISVHNVLVAYMKESPANDGYPGGHLLYGTIGSGTGVVFMDGDAIEINWQKKNQFSRTVFTTKQGKELEFNRGNIWIEIVPLGSTVSY